MFIDSHVNLHAEAFANDQDAVISRAREAGVTRMITISDKLASAQVVLGIADAHEDIWASVGQHPHNAKDAPDVTARDLVQMASHPRVCGIGETGLDRHYNLSPIEQQIASFKAHIGAARETGLPLIVHTREADELTGDLLEEGAGQGAFPLLMHCYTSGAELARRALKLGAYFSLSGILTFKAANDVRAVAAEIPLDRIILETDCPYLAPIPHRGRRCEPAFVVDVYKFFCAERGLELEQGAEIIADNFHRLFQTIPR